MSIIRLNFSCETILLCLSDLILSLIASSISRSTLFCIGIHRRLLPCFTAPFFCFVAYSRLDSSILIGSPFAFKTLIFIPPLLLLRSRFHRLSNSRFRQRLLSRLQTLLLRQTILPRWHR